METVEETITRALDMPPSAQAWGALVEALDQAWGERGVLDEDFFSPINEALATWPDDILRRSPRHWFLQPTGQKLARELHPAWHLVNCFAIEDMRPKKARFEDMIKLVEWENILHLELEHFMITSAELGLLVNEPRITRPFYSIHLSGGSSFSKTALREAGITALLRAPWARAPRHLSITGHKLGNRGIKKLFSANIFSQLRTLDLGQNAAFGNSGMEALVECAQLQNLSHLVLSWSKFASNSASLLAEAAHLPSLVWLDLAGTNLSERDLVTLAQGPALANLAHVNVSGPNLTEAVTRRVLAQHANPWTQGCEVVTSWYTESGGAPDLRELVRSR